MEFTRQAWGRYHDHPAELFTVKDPETGFSVSITDFGATLVRVQVPDRYGQVGDVNFGEDSPEEFLTKGRFFGATVGRVANRIANGEFELDGKTYKLVKNNANKHCLHGGKQSFNQKWWECTEVLEKDKKVQLIFKYVSPHMEEGFPGTLLTTLTFTITPMKLGWAFDASTDLPTLVNLTNHSYWNLEGLDTTINDHRLQFDADRYMPGDENNLPTGEVKSVVGTPVDFREGKSFAEVFEEFGDVDNNFFLTGASGLGSQGSTPKVFAELHAPASGRCMTVSTTDPCCQIYTGNYMEGAQTFGGLACKKHSAVCLETQRVPNAINYPEFANSVILRPGDRYYHETVHEFSIE